ncbi:MAG: A/G-specific adenine glycosylase [Chloroflexota bacterium]
MITSEATTALIDWYRINGRDLPWRRTRDPYEIMVSEIMLQQTQVERVIPKYTAFLDQFPTLQDLANAPTSSVIQAWAGLGYNRRALNLQRACRAIVDEHGGAVPRHFDDLVNLPGIGPYTAGAILCFAFEEDVGFVDTNIRRVLHRFHFGPEFGENARPPREFDRLAAEAVPKGRGYDWNQALIELGALVCRARVALCDECPLAQWCAARPDVARALDARSSGPRRTEPKFETTNRYLRGRIVDLLRHSESGMRCGEIAAGIDPAPDPQRLTRQLNALVGEGLVERVNRVAEHAPAYDSSSTVDDENPVYRLPR